MFKLDHVAFQVSDLEQAIQFYTEQLQFSFVSKTINEEHGEAFAYLKLQDFSLELLQNMESPLEERDVKEPYCPHLALGTDNLDELVTYLNEHNIPIVKGPMEIAGMVKWLYIADLDRNVIEFVEWIS
jgi:catechol 2,3-dioxygenase-like lactoylglutathione lyase family enzyme